ncbi:MAG TPA: PKD domain-containing protein, partial [Atribacterota bacterium]|nr:PKD domain-containing protein [Atribacterota bacterium]
AILAMEEKENIVKNNLAQQDINFALNQQSIYFYEFNGIPPSSIWQYNPIESLQTPYQPNSLMQLDNTFIAPMNQWNSVTYNPSEDYIEELDVLLHPVPNMSFLDEVFKQSGPLGDLASALADVANPYTFLPALFMLGMDIYLQSQKQIGFLYPTVTGYQISPCPESGMIMIKDNGQQMIYNISEGESGSITNIPSGDFGTFFVDAVNSFSGGIRPSVSLINDDMLNGGRVQYNNVSSEYQSQDYSLNLESHVGVTQNNLELCDTVICKIQGSGPIVMIPFKIGSWFKCDQDQKGDIKSKTTIGVRFKDDDKYYTYDLADCALNNINNSVSANQNGILMWSGVISIYAEEYGKSEIEEIYLALNSSAKKTFGLNKVNCYTSLSFSPYFLKPIISLPQDIETFPGEEVTFQTELLEGPTNATVDVSWEIPSGTESLEGYEVKHTFTETGTYDCKLMIDPEYQARPPAVEVTDPQEKFWNTNAGKIIFPFQVKVLPSLDLKVDWELPLCVPLNTRNNWELEFYPGRKTAFNVRVTNEGVKDFHMSEHQNIPLKLSLFIDNNSNHSFETNEKVWEEEIDDFSANSSKFYTVELLLSLDKKVGDTADTTIVYWPNFYDCQLQVDILPEEENIINNSIRDSVEFISSPELDAVAPDFAVENADFSVDQYKNIEVHFNLAEKSVNRSIVDKWNSYYPENPFIPQWGPIPYELWLRDGYLLYSGEVTELLYHETKSLQLDSINLSYIPAGRYEVYLGINPKMLFSESEMHNNDGHMGWLTLTDDTTSPWYTKGGDRGHTGWKNIDLKPPLITDLVIETDGIPVDMVCDSTYFYVLTSSGSIEKYNASGELQYTVSGFDGTPLLSSVMLLVYPDTENERLFVFSDDYRLVLIDTQTGNKIWTSNHLFTETTYGSKPNIREYSRTLDFDGRYLIAGSPLVLYRFDSNMDVPGLLWEKDKKRYGEAFIFGNQILAGQYLYNIQ